MKLIVHFDGACSLGRGIAGAAAVAYDETGIELGFRKHSLRRVTTPVAEYTGLHLALQLAYDLGGTDVTVMGDAELIVHHYNEVYQCRKAHLRPLLAMSYALAERLPQVKVTLFPKAGPKKKRRFGNERADELAGEAMEALA